MDVPAVSLWREVKEQGRQVARVREAAKGIDREAATAAAERIKAQREEREAEQRQKEAQEREADQRQKEQTRGRSRGREF